MRLADARDAAEEHRRRLLQTAGRHLGRSMAYSLLVPTTSSAKVGSVANGGF